mgnify:CR=1 FL=1
MNVNGKKIRASVGAMKIARTLPVSERHIEWYPLPAPIPGSLREGAVERSETEGVSPDERKHSKISEPMGPHGKPLARNNHRTTLPQSRPFGRASSLKEGAGKGWFHSTGYSLKSNVAGDFHRPYEAQNALHFTMQCAARKLQRCGRFSSPLRKLRMLYTLPCNVSPGNRNVAGRNEKDVYRYGGVVV